MKHTQGPWEFIDAEKIAEYKYAPVCVIKAGRVQVASFSWYSSSSWFPNKEESKANARLIAAAPDLLSVVQSVAIKGFHQAPEGECLCSQCELIKEARAAITKATGV